MSIRRVDDYTLELITEDENVTVYQVAEPQNNFITYESANIDAVMAYIKRHMVDKGTYLTVQRAVYVAKQNLR